MSFFISDAMAEAGQAAQPGLFEAMFPFLVIMVVFYFLLIRPQQRKAKELKAMTEALQKGDEVVSTGGLLGRVVALTDEYITLELAEGTEVIMQRAAVMTLLPKGTIKKLK